MARHLRALGRGSRRIHCGIAVVLAARAALGETAEPELGPADVPHTVRSVVIDGVLDDAVWRDALVVDLGFEVNPGENIPPAVATSAYLIEDGTRLLIAFDARDPEPEAIRAFLRDRDTAYSDDFVGVVLDTFNDERRGFEFFVNALGVQMDLTVDDANGEDDSWDALWESAGAINARGYAVEMAIPYSQLRFDRTPGAQIWGIDLLRVRPREDRDLIASSARERGRNCYLCQIGKVRGFAEAEPGKGLEVVPAVTAARSDLRDDDLGRLVAGDVDAEIGLGVRWGITSDLIANLALNPDFSQVEADVAQLDVNEQFALFYPETRPFFLEGAELFATPFDAVFTRTIADPDIGAKVTGTRGANSYGVFGAEDTVTNLVLPGALESDNETLEQSSRTLVARYRRDIGEGSMLGLLATARRGAGYDNRVTGLDGRLRPNDRHSLEFQLLRSTTRYPEAIVTGSDQPAGDFDGDAVRLDYDFGTREWFAGAGVRRLDRDFRADSGFITRVDVENRYAQLGRIWHGDGSRWFNRMRLGANVGSLHDTSGLLLERRRRIFFNFQAPSQSFMQVNFRSDQRYWDGRLYDTPGAFVYGEVRALPGLFVGVELDAGKRIDIENSRLGDELRFSPRLTWNANRHLMFRLEHTASRLDAPSGDRVFEAELLDLRLTWQFNLQSFLRLTLQQQTIERNLALYEDPDTQRRSRDRGTQLLYSYQLNPQTVFYLGYSENALADDDSVGLVPEDRAFFTKFSYAWVP